MSSWMDDGEYWTIRYDNKRKTRVLGSISIKKTALNAPKCWSRKHGKHTSKGGS